MHKITYKEVDVNAIHVDTSYQRPVSTRYKKIAENFDPLLFRTIQISERKDGSLWVIDGSHRVEAAKHLKFKTIPAEVYTGLSIEDERHMFANQDKGRVSVSLVYKYKAEANRAGTPAHTLKKLFIKYNLSPEPAYPSDKRYVRALYACLKLTTERQEHLISRVFSIYKKAPIEATNLSHFWSREVFNAFASVLKKGTTTTQIIAYIKQLSFQTLYNTAIIHPSGFITGFNAIFCPEGK